MTTLEKSASARLPVARFWVERGEGLASTAIGLGSVLIRWLPRRLSALARVQARRVALRQLHALDDRLLQDIGLRRDQVGITVDAMFRGDPVAETKQPSREVDAGAAGDTPAVDASNNRHYQSAA